MQQIVWEGDTAQGHLQIVDGPYDGRPARVLYSGDKQAAQSGIARDDKPDLLFDYNQRLLELALGLTPRTVLMLGGGVGTLPQALLAELPAAQVDMVEPDDGLTELAYRYFDLPVDDRLRLFHTDGRSFLREHAGRYDLVIVDAFMHTTIPRGLKTLEAFRAYAAHVNTPGVLAMNVISGYHGQSAHTLQQTYAAALHNFDAVDIFLASKGYSMWLPQNFILTAQKTAGNSAAQRPLAQFVRYAAVKPPETHPDMALTDQPE
jgi:spermidine synthase